MVDHRRIAQRQLTSTATTVIDFQGFLSDSLTVSPSISTSTNEASVTFPVVVEGFVSDATISPSEGFVSGATVPSSGNFGPSIAVSFGGGPTNTAITSTSVPQSASFLGISSGTLSGTAFQDASGSPTAAPVSEPKLNEFGGPQLVGLLVGIVFIMGLMGFFFVRRIRRKREGHHKLPEDKERLRSKHSHAPSNASSLTHLPMQTKVQGDGLTNNSTTFSSADSLYSVDGSIGRREHEAYYGEFGAQRSSAFAPPPRYTVTPEGLPFDSDTDPFGR